MGPTGPRNFRRQRPQRGSVGEGMVHRDATSRGCGGPEAIVVPRSARGAEVPTRDGDGAAAPGAPDGVQEHALGSAAAIPALDGLSVEPSIGEVAEVAK